MYINKYFIEFQYKFNTIFCTFHTEQYCSLWDSLMHSRPPSHKIYAIFLQQTITKPGPIVCVFQYFLRVLFLSSSFFIFYFSSFFFSLECWFGCSNLQATALHPYSWYKLRDSPSDLHQTPHASWRACCWRDLTVKAV